MIANGTAATLVLAEHYAREYKLAAAGTELYAEGEPSDNLYVLIDGWAIQHQILEDGRRQILNFATRGSLIGFQPEPESEMNHTAECLTDVTIAIIPRRRLPELFAQDPKLAFCFTTLAMGALNFAYESLTSIGRRTAREAVAHLLFRLYSWVRDQGPTATNGTAVLPLTLEHIGDSLGLTPEHVCRTLKSLREDGIVELRNGRLRVLDGEELADEAGLYDAALPVPAGADDVDEMPSAPPLAALPGGQRRSTARIASLAAARSQRQDLRAAV